jgi:hypothetical protein
MTMRNQNAKIYRANSAVLTIAVTMADGTPYDPSLNAILRWRMSKTANSAEANALARKSFGNGISFATDGKDGIVNVELDPADTDFPSGIYYHELKVEDVGDVNTSMTGFIIIRPSVSMGDNVVPGQNSVKLSGTVPTRTP